MTMDFRNRSNTKVHVVVSNANVIHWHHNSLGPGETVHCPIWTPIGYDVRVFYDTGNNAVDPAKDNVMTILGWIFTGVGVWASIAGTLVAVATGGALTPAALAGYSLAGLGVAMAAGSVALEGTDAVLNPATLPGLLGSDRYEIEIGGNAHLQGTGEQGKATLRFEGVSLRWKNTTAGHRQFTKIGDFRWVWQGDAAPGSALSITVRPDGSLAALGTDGAFYARANPGSPWQQVTTRPYIFGHKDVGGEETQAVNGVPNTICALRDGRLFASFARPRDLAHGPDLHGCFLQGDTWVRDPAFDDVSFVGELPTGLHYIKNVRAYYATNGSSPAAGDPMVQFVPPGGHEVTSFATGPGTEVVATIPAGALVHATPTPPCIWQGLSGIGGDGGKIISIARLDKDQLVGVGTDHRVYFARVSDLQAAYGS